MTNVKLKDKIKTEKIKSELRHSINVTHKIKILKWQGQDMWPDQTIKDGRTDLHFGTWNNKRESRENKT